MKKIGILGGGQLGRMLWEASASLQQSLALSPVYHNELQCPAGRGGAQIIVGKISDVPALAHFFSSVDSFAVENEFLDVKKIEEAWHLSKSGLPKGDFPTPVLDGLLIAQDKLEQKKFFLRNQIPTTEYIEISKDILNLTALKDLQQKWQGFVLKKARMGYDGKGNLVLPPHRELDLKLIQDFCSEAEVAGSRVYAERYIDFRKEVALVSCQTFAGDVGHYPLIETVQRNGVCYLAFTALGESLNETRAKEIARVVAGKLRLLGTFALEFFVTASGDLVVNEMAPRVHNSGHFTLEAAKYSQFQLHLKAYLQKTWNADDFSCRSAFAMVNLLGPAGVSGAVSKPKNFRGYWYDKDLTTPGRKLGHIIEQSDRIDDLPALLRSLSAIESSWQESLRCE